MVITDHLDRTLDRCPRSPVNSAEVGNLHR
jgi:hypothetical protein